MSGSIRNSTPGCGSPTVPSRTRPGRLAVATAVFSVMPYTSCMGTPMPMKNFSTSGAMGAAPEAAYRTRRTPIRSRSARKKKTQPTAYTTRVSAECRPPRATNRAPIRSATASHSRAFARLTGDAPASLIVMPARIFSQIRGTPKRIVGCTSRRSD